MAWFETLVNGASGGLLGVVGGLSKQVMGYFERKQQRKHDLSVAEIEMKQMEMEHSQAKDMAVIRQASIAEENAAKAFNNSMSMDKSTYFKGGSRLLEWVDFFRGMNRIILTWYLVVACMVIYFTTGEITMEKVIIDTIVFLTSVGVGWWFGDRPMGRKQK